MGRGKKPIVFGMMAVGMAGTWACQNQQKSTTTPGGAKPQTDSLDRTVLPIAEPDYPHETELDARKANTAGTL